MPNLGEALVKNQLSVLFSELLNVEVPSMKADLFETGVLDSQSFVELLLLIEEKFETHISVEDFELDNFRSIEKIAILIQQKLRRP